MQVTPALSPKPVFIDGLSSALSYAILAVKEAEVYNCICLRNNGTFKFYPTFEFWGLTRPQLHSLGLHNTYGRGAYEGVHDASTVGVHKVLNLVRQQRQAVIVDSHHIEGVFETPYNERPASRMLHPSTGGQRPALGRLPDFKSLASVNPALCLPAWVNAPALPAPAAPAPSLAAALSPRLKPLADLAGAVAKVAAVKLPKTQKSKTGATDVQAVEVPAPSAEPTPLIPLTPTTKVETTRFPRAVLVEAQQKAGWDVSTSVHMMLEFVEEAGVSSQFEDFIGKKLAANPDQG